MFETKEDCFLAADELGRQALLGHVLTDFQRGSIAGDLWIRLPIRAYLKLCVEEQQFAKAWVVEFPNAGARSLRRRNEFFAELGQWLKIAHERVKKEHPQHWSAVPDLFYDAAVGGVYEVVYRCISQNQFQNLQSLEDSLVSFMQRALGFQP